MALNISRGTVPRAQRVVVYGTEGIGKTTFAARFPDALFIDTEGGSDYIDVARTDRPGSWEALLAQVRAVRAEKPCSTLVVDTLDWAERLCCDHVIAKNRWASIESPGYGKGYTAVAEEFGRLLDLLGAVVDSGIHVVCTAHADVRKFEQPDEAASYDRWELKLQKKVAPMVKEWADALLFVDFKTIVETVDAGMGKQKGKARGGKQRVMRANHAAAWDAKNRWGLPDELPFEFERIAGFVPAMNRAPVSRPAPAAAPAKAADEAAGKAGKRPSAAEARAASMPEHWGPALQLMGPAGVTVGDVKAMAVAKGFFTADMDPADYPPEFVAQCVIAQWEKCLEFIEASRTDPDYVPFI